MTAGSQWIFDNYELEPASRVGLKLAFTAPARYDDVLRRAFPPPIWWSGRYESFDRRFEGVLFVQGLDREALDAFLNFMSKTLLIPGPLDEIWALSMHTTEQGFTEMRDLVYRAKTYRGKAGDPAEAKRLAGLFADRMAQHPAIMTSDVILPIPANPPKEPHNLPDLLGEALAVKTGVPFRSDILIKARATPEIKNLPNEEKLAALRDAYETDSRLDGKKVVFVDDILYSGTTLGVVGEVLVNAGAAQTIGTVATKTLRSEREPG